MGEEGVHLMVARKAERARISARIDSLLSPFYSI
jgi:hypothetical protein